MLLTGGCSLLKGINHLAEEVFGMPVHLTHAQTVSGLTSAFENPQFSTAIGLIKYAEAMQPERPPASSRGSRKRLRFFSAAGALALALRLRRSRRRRAALPCTSTRRAPPMIELPRSTSPSAPPRLKVLGLGGAGCNMLDRLVLDGLEGAEMIAMNTDVQALAGSVAARKVHIGAAATRGLGAGGDPELGYAAAEEAGAEFSALFDAGDLVFLLGGLGGGTGSGALPLIAHFAREQGAQVVVFATLPVRV